MRPGRFERVEDKISLEKAYEKAQKILAVEEIDIRSFDDLYDPEKIEQDLEYIEKKEEIFNKENVQERQELNMLSSVFEAIFFEQAELSEWLGPNAHTIKSSRFDDIKNGVDSIAEFESEEGDISRLALAIDITFGPQLQKKMARIKKEIERGELAHIKYFVSASEGFRGELKNVPRVVVGADKKMVKELYEIWIEGKKKELSEHKIQFQVLEEIAMQLRTFEKYAKKNDVEHLIPVYQRAIKIIERVMAENGQILTTEDFLEDNVFSTLYEELKKF